MQSVRGAGCSEMDSESELYGGDEAIWQMIMMVNYQMKAGEVCASSWLEVPGEQCFKESNCVVQSSPLLSEHAQFSRRPRSTDVHQLC